MPRKNHRVDGGNYHVESSDLGMTEEEHLRSEAARYVVSFAENDAYYERRFYGYVDYNEREGREAVVSRTLGLFKEAARHHELRQRRLHVYAYRRVNPAHANVNGAGHDGCLNFGPSSSFDSSLGPATAGLPRAAQRIDGDHSRQMSDMSSEMYTTELHTLCTVDAAAGESDLAVEFSNFLGLARIVEHPIIGETHDTNVRMSHAAGCFVVLDGCGGGTESAEWAASHRLLPPRLPLTAGGFEYRDAEASLSLLPRIPASCDRKDSERGYRFQVKEYPRFGAALLALYRQCERMSCATAADDEAYYAYVKAEHAKCGRPCSDKQLAEVLPGKAYSVYIHSLQETIAD